MSTISFITFLSVFFSYASATNGTLFRKLSNSDINVGGFNLINVFLVQYQLQCAALGQLHNESHGFGFSAQQQDFNCYVWTKSTDPNNRNALFYNFDNYVKTENDFRNSSSTTGTNSPPANAIASTVSASTIAQTTSLTTLSSPLAESAEQWSTESTMTEASDSPNVTAVPTTPISLTLATTPSVSAPGPCPYMYRGAACDQLCFVADAYSTHDVVNSLCMYRSWTVSLNPDSPYPVIDCWEVCAWNDTCYGVTYDMNLKACYLTIADVDSTQCIERSAPYYVYYSFKCFVGGSVG